ncbi:LPS export ABC transporter permease LptG [Bdellovibrionales bacterium]|nr:LPS export ABC transporter permease LptG [Bdellovibrionales bacterium]
MDRYIIKSYLVYFIAGLSVFTTIFLVIDFMSIFAQNDVSIAVLGRYYLYYIPGIVYQMLPISCLLGTLFTLSSLNESHELVALFSMGHSLARISAPILAVVAIISVLSFWMGDRILPKVTQKKNYVWYVEVRNQPGRYATVKTNKIWYRSENVLFNISSLNAKEERAQGVSFYYFDSRWKLIQMIQAQTAEMRGEFWHLKNGSVTLFVEESVFPLSRQFQEKTITMNKDVVDLGKSSQPSEVQSLEELKRFITQNREAGLDTMHYEVDYHRKISFAFAGFILSLMGIPFSVGSRRSGKGVASVGICVGLAFLYWMGFSSSITMGRNGMLSPILAAWLSNGLMIAFASFFLIRLKK